MVKLPRPPLNGFRLCHSFGYTILASLIAFGLVYWTTRRVTIPMLSDGFAVAGLLLLSLGLGRIVNNLGFFESTKFGTRKLIEIIRTRDYRGSESKMETYVEYLQRDRVKRNPWEYFVPAGVALLLSVLFVVLVV